MRAAWLLLALATCTVRSPESEMGDPIPLSAPHRTTFRMPVELLVTTPSGRNLALHTFATHGLHEVRFTPREPGPHRWIAIADGRTIAEGTWLGVASSAPGFVRIDPLRPHRLVRDDGTNVYILGENRINVYDPTWNYEAAHVDAYLARMHAYGMTTIRVFLLSDCESETARGGYQIGCLEPAVGQFDERTADAIDGLFDAAARHGIDVVLVAYAIGFTPGTETWRSWSDNPYSKLAASPEAFFADRRFRVHAAERLRYIADRWASSPRLLAIDLLNEPEWDGRVAERTWIPWAEEMSRTWSTVDPYGHLVTAGSVGLQWNVDGDERPWYASQADDVVQWHLYGKEFYDPPSLALEMARKVNETWGFGKPILCGEFAYGGEAKPAYDHTHDGIWSLLFNGAGALAHTAPPFELDSDEPMTPARGAHFRVLSRLLATFGPRTPYAPFWDAEIDRPDARVWSLMNEARTHRLLWLLTRRPATGTTVTLPSPAGIAWDVQWVNDVDGTERGTETATAGADRRLVLRPPAFEKHLAAVLRRR